MNTLRLIRQRFKVRVQGCCMPVASSHGTRLTLADMWAELGYERGVEVGVMRGDYSLELLNRIPTCHLTCIDPWTTYDNSSRTRKSQDKNFQITTDRLKSFVDGGRTQILRATSLEVVGTFYDNSLDFVFIDGDHMFDYCCVDIINWSKKVKSGGMVAVHDYVPMRHSGVIQAVNAYTFSHNIFPWFVTREELPTAFGLSHDRCYYPLLYIK